MRFEKCMFYKLIMILLLTYFVFTCSPLDFKIRSDVVDAVWAESKQVIMF